MFIWRENIEGKKVFGADLKKKTLVERKFYGKKY
jgi:hypothetical protein